jgi:hypothetical protein
MHLIPYNKEEGRTASKSHHRKFDYFLYLPTDIHKKRFAGLLKIFKDVLKKRNALF